MKRFAAASLLGYVATALGLTAWFINSPLLVGYYFWQGSLITLAVGSHWAYEQSKGIKPARQEKDRVPQNRLDVPPPFLNGLQESSRVP